MNQLVVLGMHRSGTSLVSGLLNMLGLHIGSEPDLMPPQQDNPKGFFERTDVVTINNAILLENQATWDCPLGVLSNRCSENISKQTENEIKKVVEGLAKNSPFLIKDPRLCLTIGAWQKYLKNPVYLLVYRHPFEIALSLYKRNRVPFFVGMALWEFYTINSLSAVEGNETLYAEHSEVLSNPFNFLLDIKAKLEGVGFAKLIDPEEPKVKMFGARNESFNETAAVAPDLYMTESAVALLNLLRSEDLRNKTATPELSAWCVNTLSGYSGIERGADNRWSLLQALKHSDEKLTDLAVAEASNRKELVKLRKIYQSLDQEHHDLAAAYRNDNEELSVLKGKYTQLVNDHSNLSSSYASELKKLDSELEKNQTLSESCETLSEFVQTVSGKNENLVKRCTKLENEIQQLNSQNDCVVKSLTKLKSEQDEAIKQNQELATALIEHQRSVVGLLTTTFTKLYKLITLRIGKPTGLESAIALAVLQESRNASQLCLSATQNISKLDLLQLLVRKALASPGRTLRSINLERVKNFRRVFFELPKHQASIAVNSAIQRYLENPVEQIAFETYKGEVIDLPDCDKPQVSILIPVYNELSTTLNCIKSIFENTDFEQNTYQIVLADDCSTDDTIHISKYVRGVKYVRQQTNQGFLRNCNAAAKSCNSEFLVILNNDTLVQKDWLRHLVDLLNSDNEIGLVGPKFLFGDGSLQEAGGIIWSDASGWNWGRGQDPTLPQFNYVRNVDYISGACILLRKKLWDELGGFDHDFLPAYYEDTDLAFRIRQIGCRVCYQPLSRVVHLEGISHGTDENQGVKRFQAANKEKFRLKWGNILSSSHFNNGEHVFLARERMASRKTILVIDHYVPHYDRDAGSRCCYHYIKLFRNAGFKVIFLGDNFYPHEPYTSGLQNLGVEVLYGNWYAHNWKDWLRTNGIYIDYVFMQRPHIVTKYISVLRQLPVIPRLIYFGHDLHFLRVSRQSEIERSEKLKNEARRWKQQEISVFEQVDVICYPSQHEVDVVKKINSKFNVTAIPLYIFDRFETNNPGFSQRNDILFVGGYGHPPNLDAIKWFVRDIFPLVTKKCPELNLLIVGSNPPDELVALNNTSIRVFGEVSEEALDELYKEVKVAIVPLRFGAGVKGKVLEALSKSVPVVTTPIGAEGVPEAESCLRVEKTAADFAAAVIEVISDNNVWDQLSANGLEVIKNHFSEQYVMEKVFRDMGIDSCSSDDSGYFETKREYVQSERRRVATALGA